MSSLLKQRPGMTPRFFSQKMAANEPEKKMPSTAANATRRSPYDAFVSQIQRKAHSAFFLIHGRVSIARNRRCLLHTMHRYNQDIEYNFYNLIEYYFMDNIQNVSKL